MASKEKTMFIKTYLSTKLAGFRNLVFPELTHAIIKR
jgi:hypothetical protein